MDAESLLSPAWRTELEFQLSLLRLMYPRTTLDEGASARIVELEQIQSRDARKDLHYPFPESSQL
jgi:hypothetical protein